MVTLGLFQLIFPVFAVSFILLSCSLNMVLSTKKSPEILRILGGRSATITEYPYTVQVLNHGALCGGVILRSHVILTAAHCFDFNEDPSFIDVVVGATNIRGGKAHQVLKISIHVQYGATSRFDNDIALVLLKTHLALARDRTVKALVVANERWMVNHTELMIVGWGLQGNSTSISKVLQQAHIYYVEFSACQTLFASFVNLTRGMFCGFRRSADTCAGDSGGPVTWNGYLVGLVSFGFKCGQNIYPGVYVNVPRYLSWIKMKINRFNKLFCEVNGHIVPNVDL